MIYKIIYSQSEVARKSPKFTLISQIGEVAYSWGNGEMGKCRNDEMGNEEWGMGNGEWGMGNGEWGMGNGKMRNEAWEWGMENEEWRMGNGEWGMGNGEWGMGNGK